jgi:multiple sugar transport system permease protein
VRRRLTSVVIHVVLVVGAVLTLVPLVWMVSASLMPTGEASAFPPALLPSHVTLEHYRALFSSLNLGRCLLNSTVIATTATAFCLLLTSMAGYAFARLRFAGRDRIFSSLLAGMVIPAQVAMLPLFLELKSLGLVNTYLGVLIPYLAPIFGIFMVRQYAMAVPTDLLDAARVDGAGELWVYWHVVLPLCRPILVTLGVFVFMGTWNDFMWPLIALTDDRLYTLPVALANLVGEHAQDTELMMAGSVLTVLPVLVLFMALQRHYIEGITAGGVKE